MWGLRPLSFVGDVGVGPSLRDVASWCLRVVAPSAVPMMRRSTQPIPKEPEAICQRLRRMACADRWLSRVTIFSLYSGIGSGALVKGQKAFAAVEQQSRQMMRMRCFMVIGVGLRVGFNASVGIQRRTRIPCSQSLAMGRIVLCPARSDKHP